MFRHFAALCTMTLLVATAHSEEVVEVSGDEGASLTLEDLPGTWREVRNLRAERNSAIVKVAAQREALIRTLEKMQTAYFNVGMKEEAEAVQQQILQLKQQSEVVLPEPPVDEEANLTPIELRGHVGEVHVVAATGTENGNVWGSGIYTDDSNVGTAAVHAGVLESGES
ncbi:MAG: hypothetical protein KDA69_01070 [Planctomycetaceae bacterium]|nr:hypothetical protein [Planctomycetaceae bacterium]